MTPQVLGVLRGVLARLARPRWITSWNQDELAAASRAVVVVMLGLLFTAPAIWGLGLLLGWRFTILIIVTVTVVGAVPYVRRPPSW